MKKHLKFWICAIAFLWLATALVVAVTYPMLRATLAEMGAR